MCYLRRGILGCSRFYFCMLSALVVYILFYVSNNWKWPKSTERAPISWELKPAAIPDLKHAIRAEFVTTLIQPNQQCTKNTKLAIIITSAPGNFEARKVIRDTWGSVIPERNDVFLAFLLGTTFNENIKKKLQEEIKNSSDIIQEDFIDSYDNLTIKSVMMLKWINQSCIQTQYVVKIDDDMFLHIPNLMSYLEANGHPSLLVGSLFKGAAPERNPRSKWYSANFKYKTYPNYLSGTAYVFSGELVNLLYRTALDTPYFRLEDVFLTGICAKRANLKPIDHPHFHHTHQCPEPCWFNSLITAHRMTIKQLYSVWENMHKEDLNCEKIFKKLWLNFLRFMSYCQYD